MKTLKSKKEKDSAQQSYNFLKVKTKKKIDKYYENHVKPTNKRV